MPLFLLQELFGKSYLPVACIEGESSDIAELGEKYLRKRDVHPDEEVFTIREEEWVKFRVRTINYRPDRIGARNKIYTVSLKPIDLIKKGS